MKVPLPQDPNAAHYYVELDLLSWAEREYGAEFAAFMEKHYEPVDVLFRLAENHSIVLLNGGGFDGPEWSVRISMANLMMPAYEQIGTWLADSVTDYLAEFKKSRPVQHRPAAHGPGRRRHVPRPDRRLNGRPTRSGPGDTRAGRR
jgi:aspartate 4-decarboxylase